MFHLLLLRPSADSILASGLSCCLILEPPVSTCPLASPLLSGVPAVQPGLVGSGGLGTGVG